MAMTMQPDIPWNVAGIAPEAREAARASARREGLSVGEWLTRRILRNLQEPGATAAEWWFADAGRTPSNENPICSGHERNHDEPRSQLETPNSSRGRGQVRNVPDTVTAPIKFPARNDSQNVEPLNERIVRLDGRLARVEIRAAAEEAKHAETIRALQAKVAELTEQISRSTSRSAAQDTQLAKAIEAVTEKFVHAQGDATEQQSELGTRIAALAEGTAAQETKLVKAIEAVSERFLQFQGEAAGQQGVIDARIADLAENSVSVGAKIAEVREETERQLRGVSDRVAATEVAIEAGRCDAGELDRIGGSLGNLARRFEAAEAEYLNNVERFESRLTRIEADSGETIIDRRLQSIEQALTDMARLIEKNTPEKPAATDILELSEPADAKPEVAYPRDVPPPPVTPFRTGTAAPILDLPPFPEKPRSSFAPSPEPPASSPTSDLRAAAARFDDSPGRPVSAEVDSFIAAARGNASQENSSPPRTASFSWVDPAGQKQADATHTRLMLLGGLGLLVFVAIGLGLYLSNTEGPGAVPLASKPAHYVAVAKGKTLAHAQPPQHATAAAAPSVKPVGKTPGPAPVQPRMFTQNHQTGTPARLVPTAPAAGPAKSPTPLARLAALANTGHAKAQEVLGLAYLDGDGVAVNEAEGAKWLERAAARGEAVAAYRLGTLYERGQGVAADPAKAAQWYAVAAKAGNRKAMHNLAVAYAQGSGVQKDLPLAAQWFTRAANLGLADSQFNLAVLYERGLGVPQSLAQAYKWYTIAAAQGDTGSKERKEAIGLQLNANDKAVAERTAAQFQPAPLDGAANAPPVAASLVGSA